MFFDPALSASGQMACATCHDPNHAFGPANALPVQLGGGDLRQPGLRAVPSLKYLQAVPQFTEHFFDYEDEGDESVETARGRADLGRPRRSGHAQARIPLLSPFEMGNGAGDGGRHALRGRLRPAAAGDLRRRRRRRSATSFTGLMKALEVFQQDYRAFYPYSSKYDAYLAGKATLTPRRPGG